MGDCPRCRAWCPGGDDLGSYFSCGSHESVVGNRGDALIIVAFVESDECRRNQRRMKDEDYYASPLADVERRLDELESKLAMKETQQ